MRQPCSPATCGNGGGLKTEITGVRPALLSEDVERNLNELRAFRHFFRHAYGVELKPEQVHAVAKTADRIRDPLKAALDQFTDRITQGAE
jgi:hypothetical protein